MGQFLLEAVLLSMFGGLVGVAIGVVVGQLSVGGFQLVVLFDEAWQAPKRTNRLTVVLVVALLVVTGFAGSVLVQKHHDTALAAAAAGAGTRRTAGAGAGGSGAAEPPRRRRHRRTIDADAIEVTDRSGAIVRVFVPRTATVTTLGLAGLASGTPVSVAGTKAVDGSVTATSVTVRPAG